tara:strand:- start:9076 stop:9717 length:642 start_codon:yes stop_codon:yes gene_type:complete
MTSQLIKSLYYVLDNPNFNKDCISGGQLKSKEWLVKKVEEYCPDLGIVFLCAGWYATLATMLFESKVLITKIRSFDVDDTCKDIAEQFNMPWVIDQWKFKATTLDINTIQYPTTYETLTYDKKFVTLTDMPDTIINTSCEHIPNFSDWYSTIPKGKLVILQSNNFTDLQEHVNCSSSLKEFSASVPMTETLYEGELDLTDQGGYIRFMKIGVK